MMILLENKSSKPYWIKSVLKLNHWFGFLGSKKCDHVFDNWQRGYTATMQETGDLPEINSSVMKKKVSTRLCATT